MLDNQNYGYRIMGDAMTTILDDRYVRVQPANSILLASRPAVAGRRGHRLRAVVSRRRGFHRRAARRSTSAAIFLLGKAGYLADPLYAPIAIVLSAAFSMAARYVLEDRERRKVERIFGHYVDPRIVKQLAATHSVDEVISKGERRDLTLLFVDIRGFTAMSEAMTAEDVLRVIQHYLDEMSTLILKWDGTIDKYVGDEVVALWNAPVAQPNHALLALRCAYDLIAQAPALHRRARRARPAAGQLGHRHQHRSGRGRQHGQQGSAAVHRARRHGQHGGAILQRRAGVQHPHRLADVPGVLATTSRSTRCRAFSSRASRRRSSES